LGVVEEASEVGVDEDDPDYARVRCGYDRRDEPVGSRTSGSNSLQTDESSPPPASNTTAGDPAPQIDAHSGPPRTSCAEGLSRRIRPRPSSYDKTSTLKTTTPLNVVPSICTP
jgi:hypothetical protein